MTESVLEMHALRRNAAAPNDAPVSDIRPSSMQESSQIDLDVNDSSGPQATSEPASDRETAEQWQPTRAYQVMLLAAGFGMIFQVIGINSIYGIFQVRPLLSLDNETYLAD